MTKYKLKKDLPTFNAGDEFYLSKKGNLILAGSNVVACAASTLREFPNILRDWFEKIEDELELPGQFVRSSQDGETYTLGYGIQCEDGHYEIVPEKVWGYEPEKDKALAGVGLSFRTPEECQRKIEYLRAEATLERDTKGFKLKSNSQPFYGVRYSTALRGLVICECGLEGHAPIKTLANRLHFATYDDATASMKAHDKEWRTYLGVDDE